MVSTTTLSCIFFHTPHNLLKTLLPDGEHHEKTHGVHEELCQEFLFQDRIAKIVFLVT